MAYIGRPGATAPLTSADIPDNTITASKIVDGAVDFQNELGFLENASGTQNLTGTISTERMYLNDSYTLTGDVTVTGHLALGSIADSDVVITQDSTERTITGSGTIEAGRLMNDVPSLTGMTGELGSTVTGTLGSGITFPAGHVCKVYSATYTSTHTIPTSFTWTNVGNGGTGELNITCDAPQSQSSKYLIFASVCHSTQNNGAINFRLVDGSSNPISQGDTAGSRTRTWMGRGHYSTDASVYNVENTSMNFLWYPNSPSAQTIKVQCTCFDSSVFYINRSHNDNDEAWQVRATSSLTIMEITG